MKDAFYISIETLHAPGDGQMENVSGASAILSTGMLRLASVSRQPDTHMCSHHRLDVCQLVRERRMYPSPGPWLHGKSSVLPSLCLWKWCFILSRWSFLSYSPTFSYPHLLGMWYMRPLSVSGTHSECGVQQSYSQTCTLSNSVFSSSTAVKISSTRECYAAHVSRPLLYLSQGYSLQVTN